MNYENLMTVMRRLALEAGDVIMDIYETNDFYNSSVVSPSYF